VAKAIASGKALRSTVIYVLILALLMGYASYMLLKGLKDRPITDWDEARHGSNAYEMMQSGDYIVHTYNGEVDYWNLKPPLAAWMIALGYRIFGLNALGLRMYSVISMMILLLVVALWTKRRFGSFASLASVTLLLANSIIFEKYFTRFGDPNTLFVLLYTVAMLCMLDSQKDVRKLYGSAVCFGLAYMTKSWHAALIPITCLVYVIATGKLKELKLKNYLLLIFWGLLPILPWGIARMTRDGLTFFIKSVTVDVYARSSMDLEDHGADVLYYLRFVLSKPMLLLCGGLCLLGLGGNLFGKKPLNTTQLGIALWVLLPVVLFSIPVSKISWYIFPTVPALALAGGMVLAKLWKLPKRSALLNAVLVVVLAATGYQLYGNIRTITQDNYVNVFRRAVEEALDRDVDSGVHMYVQYSPEEVNWRPAEFLCAQLYGDAKCINGGLEAYEEDEESALLMISKLGFDHSLLELYPIYYEDSSVYILENLGG